MPVYAVDKPLGPTSHDLVAQARRILRTRRVGHAGTLDPLASGVLLLLSDEATKLSPWLTGSDKEYLAWVAFGAGTPTLDAEGPIQQRGDPATINPRAIEDALPPFLSLSEQLPPRFSAIKRDGEASYVAARRGDLEAAPLPPRPAGYKRVELLAFGPREALPRRFAASLEGWRPDDDGRELELPPALVDLPVALLALRVTAGTYVRSFARDVGAALGVPAHLAGLVRTRVGSIGLGQTIEMTSLDDHPGLPAAEALPLPKLTVSAAQAARLRQGQRLPASELDGTGTVGLTSTDGELVAIAELSPDGMRLLRVWPSIRTPH